MSSRHAEPQVTVEQWLPAWFANASDRDVQPKQRASLGLMLASVLVDSKFSQLPLEQVTPTKLFKFYRKRIRRSLPQPWARRLYALMHRGFVASIDATAYNETRFDFYLLAIQFGRAIRKTWQGVIAVFVIWAMFFSIAVEIQAQKDDESFGSTAITMLRDGGLGPVVAAIEDLYYTYIERPLVGGIPSIAANFDGSGSKPSPSPTSTYPAATVAVNPDWGLAQDPSKLPPQAISPAATPQPDEGVWEPTQIMVNGIPAVYVARIRPDAVHTSYYANLVWFDPRLLAFQQIPGTHVPEGNYDHGTGLVPDNLRPYYVAGLADAFLMSDSQGGYMLGDKVIRTMREGKATLVTYTDGSIDVVQWGRDPLRGPIQAARQNLDLNVDGGVSQVLSETQAKWGWVWHGTGSGKNLVWRSSIGVRADGTVVYVVGNWLSAKSLADMMVRAGAVRSMILDMNSGYANGFFYGPYVGGKKIDPTIPREVTRFWAPSTRDFVAVYMKSPAN